MANVRLLGLQLQLRPDVTSTAYIEFSTLNTKVDGQPILTSPTHSEPLLTCKHQDMKLHIDDSYHTDSYAMCHKSTSVHWRLWFLSRDFKNHVLSLGGSGSRHGIVSLVRLHTAQPHTHGTHTYDGTAAVRPHGEQGQGKHIAAHTRNRQEAGSTRLSQLREKVEDNVRWEHSRGERKLLVL